MKIIFNPIAIAKARADAEKRNKTSPKEKFRLSATVAVTFTPALHSQLLRYAESIGATKSKAIKRLITAYCEAPKTLVQPRGTPRVTSDTVEPKRTVAMTWHFSDTDTRNQLDNIAKRNKLTTSTLVRRIVYNNTKAYMSPNLEEQIEATADAWL